MIRLLFVHYSWLTACEMMSFMIPSLFLAVIHDSRFHPRCYEHFQAMFDLNYPVFQF